MPGNTPHGRFSVVLTGTPAEIPPVRRAIQELARANGFADRASDLTLALDELVANAREHGRPPIGVTTWYDGRVVLEVSDSGSGFDDRAAVPDRPPPMLGHRGRGLWIVRQVSDHMHVHSAVGGTTVTVEFTHEPQIGA